MATFDLKTKEGVRKYYCPDNGGYVREDNRAGKQVNDTLGYYGDMLYASANSLASIIRKARRKELALRKQQLR